MLVNSTMSYAQAMLESKYVDNEIYATWFDYFVDSIVQQDPVVYILGLENYQKFIAAGGGLDENLRTRFLDISNAFLLITLYHEIAHALLEHSRLWHEKFPEKASAELSEWTEEQFSYSRELETLADKYALYLLNEIANFDPSHGVSNWILWPLIRHESIISINGEKSLLPTHPAPEKRMNDLVTELFILQDKTEQLQRYLQQMTDYMEGVKNKIRKGTIRNYHMKFRVLFPKNISKHETRFLMRDCVLSSVYDLALKPCDRRYPTFIKQ